MRRRTTRTQLHFHPSLQKRLGRLPQVEFRSNLPPQAFDVEQRFLEQDERGCTSTLKRRDARNSCRSTTPREMSFNGLPRPRHMRGLPRFQPVWMCVSLGTQPDSTRAVATRPVVVLEERDES